MNAASKPLQQARFELPRVGSLWSPDGLDVCEVRATCAGELVVIVVHWHARRIKRPSIYQSLEQFYREFTAHVAPFDPDKHVDRFRGQD